MSRRGRAVIDRASRGERSSLLLTTGAGSQLALAGLSTEDVGRLLELALSIMTTAHCEAESVTGPGRYLALPGRPLRRR